jgi:hypothetical protein
VVGVDFEGWAETLEESVELAGINEHHGLMRIARPGLIRGCDGQTTQSLPFDYPCQPITPTLQLDIDRDVPIFAVDFLETHLCWQLT